MYKRIYQIILCSAIETAIHPQGQTLALGNNKRGNFVRAVELDKRKPMVSIDMYTYIEAVQFFPVGAVYEIGCFLSF